MADDGYNDYFLPAGATIIPNVWCVFMFSVHCQLWLNRTPIRAILHDESVYPDPLSFKPERFLDSSVDRPEAAFGFGRRICPGMHLALDSGKHYTLPTRVRAVE